MITEFKDEHHFLSNFYFVDIKWQGKIWPTAEHIYQAMKTKDKTIQESIRNLATPTKAKKVGRTLVLRPLWKQVKFSIMYVVVYEKFKQCEDLRKLLFATGTEELVEGNTWGDTYWGKDLTTGVGTNYLGQILMEVRAVLKNEIGVQLAFPKV